MAITSEWGQITPTLNEASEVIRWDIEKSFTDTYGNGVDEEGNPTEVNTLTLSETVDFEEADQKALSAWTRSEILGLAPSDHWDAVFESYTASLKGPGPVETKVEDFVLPSS